MRQLSLIDKVIHECDKTLRTLARGNQSSKRQSPSANMVNTPTLSDSERTHSASLMRVNHTGEVCAQALYQGQALTAKLPHVRREMETAAAEEIDHLSWCEQRLKQLDAQPSRLNPLWYGLSFGLGAGAGLIGDRMSLGFIAATEDQVCQHLQSHLNELPDNDTPSRAIVTQMLDDEAQHAAMARQAGATEFPNFVKQAMSHLSKIMTQSSYRL